MLLLYIGAFRRGSGCGQCGLFMYVCVCCVLVVFLCFVLVDYVLCDIGVLVKTVFLSVCGQCIHVCTACV